MKSSKGQLVVGIFWLITMVLYLLTKSDLGWMIKNPWQTASQMAALLGAMLLAITVIMSGRYKFLEELFGGLDKVYKKHHLYGVIAFTLLIHHPLLLVAKSLNNPDLVLRYLIPSNNLAYSMGVYAVYCLILLLTFTILIKLPYNRWLQTHQFMGLTLIFAVLHINNISSDVSVVPALKFWILGWIMIALGSYLYKRFGYWKLGPRFEYIVEEVRKGEEIIDIYIKPVKIRLHHKMGQFVFVSFEQRGLEELHPFSIASAEGKTTVRIVVKMVGDYTNRLVDLKAGTRVKIFGPYGRLFKGINDKPKVMMIAGGIGITPFLGIIETIKNNSEEIQVDLFYSNKSEDKTFEHQRLLRLEKEMKNFKYYPHFSQMEGHLSVVTIMDKVKNINKIPILLCGPTGMMISLEDQLVKIGVNKDHIFFEDFSLI